MSSNSTPIEIQCNILSSAKTDRMQEAHISKESVCSYTKVNEQRLENDTVLNCKWSVFCKILIPCLNVNEQVVFECKLNITFAYLL